MHRKLSMLALAALFLSYTTHVAAQMNVSKRPSILSLGVAGVATPQTNILSVAAPLANLTNRAVAEAKIDPADGFVVITSRCSMEMVQKSVTMGIPTLVAISAPTTLAIRLAQDAGLRMIALARADSLTVYAEGRAEGGQ